MRNIQICGWLESISINPDKRNATENSAGSLIICFTSFRAINFLFSPIFLVVLHITELCADMGV
jgi:hypothetical protein